MPRKKIKDLGIKDGRECTICGRIISRYNPGPNCFCHEQEHDAGKSRQASHCVAVKQPVLQEERFDSKFDTGPESYGGLRF